MRIGFYTPNYPTVNSAGGIGSYTQALSRGLASRGHDVHVLVADGDGCTMDGAVKLQQVSTRHAPLADRLIPGAGACWRVHRTIRDLHRTAKLDLVEFPNWEGFGLLSVVLKRLPTVARLSTSSAEALEIDGKPVSRWDRWNVRRERWQSLIADQAVTHSAAHRRVMAAEFGCDEERIKVIPLAVQTFPRFVRPVRAQEPPTVVSLGRLEHRKGTLELLHAIPNVLQRVPDARFVLIGADRPHAPGNRTHAQYLKEDFPTSVQEAVMLTGPLPDEEVDRWLQSADLFVAPSRYESFGLVFLEAMRWGTPVIGTTAGGIPEIVEDKKSGWLVAPQSPNELADAMALLLLQPTLRESLARAGRLRAETVFSVDAMVTRTEDLYRATIDRRRSRR
jgi:glycosyltransferase involved in cell wall biosynthesis